MRKSEEEYRNLLEQANDGIIIAQDETYRYVNQKMTKMLGYTIVKIANNHISKYIHPDDYPIVLERYKRRIAGEEATALY